MNIWISTKNLHQRPTSKAFMAGFDLTLFEKKPVLGILRGVSEASLSGVLEAAFSGGLRFLEVTLNTSDALHFIRKAVQQFPDFCVGAGTVLTPDSAQMAVDAGAKFIVSPSLNENVAEFCSKNGVAFFPGALTPTEIERAWNTGATMVKVFPASQMGPEYFKSLKGPFDHIKLMAVGGINLENIPAYCSAGASAFALGGSIFSLSRMANHQYLNIQKDIEEFVLAVNKNYSNIIE